MAANAAAAPSRSAAAAKRAARFAVAAVASAAAAGISAATESVVVAATALTEPSSTASTGSTPSLPGRSRLVLLRPSRLQLLVVCPARSRLSYLWLRRWPVYTLPGGLQHAADAATTAISAALSGRARLVLRDARVRLRVVRGERSGLHAS